MPAQYCPRVPLFESYVLGVPLPTQFTLSHLLKVPGALQSKKFVTHQEWLSVGGSTLGLSEPVAAAMFEAFCTYTMTADERLAHVREELAWAQSGQRSQWMRSRKVSLPPFLIFIFCQQYKAAAGGSAWQARPSADDYLRAKPSEQERISVFVSQHLYHLLALIAPNYKVNYSHIQALGLILTEVSDTAPASEADSAAPLAGRPFGSQMHFWHDKTALVDIHTVSQFITDNMVSPERVGHPLHVLPPNRAGGPTQVSPGDITWSMGGRPRRTGVIAGVVKNMVYKNTAVHGVVASVQLSDCHFSTFYLLGAFDDIAITGCTGCTLVLGPTGGTVTVRGCSRLNIVVPCRSLSLQDVTDSRVYTCCNTPPLVFAGCEKVNFAPYNTFYPALEGHLQQAAVNPLHNMWNQYVSFSPSPSLGTLPVEHFASVCPATNQPNRHHDQPPLPHSLRFL